MFEWEAERFLEEDDGGAAEGWDVMSMGSGAIVFVFFRFSFPLTLAIELCCKSAVVKPRWRNFVLAVCGADLVRMSRQDEFSSLGDGDWYE